MATKKEQAAKKKADAAEKKAAEFKAEVKAVIEEIFAEAQAAAEEAANNAPEPAGEPIKPSDWFRFQKFTEEEQKLSDEITAKATDLMKSLYELPFYPGTGAGNAQNRLREVVMWANRAIADSHID